MNLGKIFFISGPSGSGKGTVINALKDRHDDWVFPPSCSTRDPRPGERDGDPYYFLSQEAFEEKIAKGAFLEYAHVHETGHLYGTLKAPMIEGVEQGKIVVKEFDVQGFQAAKKALPRDYYVSIFFTPQDPPEVIIQRIKERSEMRDEEVAHRMESMKKEMALADMYDHQVVSIGGQIEPMIQEVEAIVDQSLSPAPSFPTP